METQTEPAPVQTLVSSAEPLEIEYEPCFLDEAVLRAAGTRPEGRLFYRERDRTYHVANVEERARAFDALNVVWYERFDLARPLRDALAEHPLVLAGVARCAVGRPPRRQDAGAELLVQRPHPGESTRASRLLRILFAPEALFVPDSLVRFLRRELQHVADMLDPRFGYEPRLPQASGGPTHERLLRDRYRVLWNATIDGRLVRAGRLPSTARAERRAEFALVFPALADTDAFARFFDDPTPTHAKLAAFVAAPSAPGHAAAGACALCGFPGNDVDPDLHTLPARVREEIVGDFPGWTPTQGCCRQCADLYRARPLSLSDAAALPGIR